jgi:hypothetical protein
MIKPTIYLLLILTIILPFNATSQPPSFKQRGFYLHEGWYFNYPFAVKTWSRDDYSKMFQFLYSMKYGQVALWPMLEAIPAPLREADKSAITEFKNIIDDAHKYGLKCWLVQNANLTPTDSSIAVLPWKQRVPYDSWKQVRLDNPNDRENYLAHRIAMIKILNNADAYVTIDGDPGGYAGAKPEDWLKVFLSDRAAIDMHGINPTKQLLIPWIWSGWGAGVVWGGNASNSPLLIKPFTSASLQLFKKEMPHPWQILAGRSHREDWANGRVNVLLADSLGMMDRTTILCYEAIEFEPTPPASILQFDLIRKIITQEAQYAATAAGIFGNAQQPVMVLPNIYFFARGTYDIAYLNKTDEAVLKDFADFLGGSSDILIPAWSCLQRRLDELPKNLPDKLRTIQLKGEAAAYIPGGSVLYLEILAKEVECRIHLLEATVAPATTYKQAAKNIAKAVTAMVSWWNMHGYVISGNPGQPFSLDYVHSSQVAVLKDWCSKNVKNNAKVYTEAEKLLCKNKVLEKSQTVKVLNYLLPREGD